MHKRGFLVLWSQRQQDVAATRALKLRFSNSSEDRTPLVCPYAALSCHPSARERRVHVSKTSFVKNLTPSLIVPVPFFLSTRLVEPPLSKNHHGHHCFLCASHSHHPHTHQTGSPPTSHANESANHPPGPESVGACDFGRSSRPSTTARRIESGPPAA